MNTPHILIADDERSIRLALEAAHVRALVSIPMSARGRREAPIGWLVLTFNDIRGRPANSSRLATWRFFKSNVQNW